MPSRICSQVDVNNLASIGGIVPVLRAPVRECVATYELVDSENRVPTTSDCAQLVWSDGDHVKSTHAGHLRQIDACHANYTHACTPSS